MKQQHTKVKEGASLSRGRSHFTIAASPFNAVKLDLAILMVLALIVSILVFFLVNGHGKQIVYLGAYGFLAMLWIIYRSRRILRQQQVIDANENGKET